MSEGRLQRAFLDAIREAPDDDAPRMVYADWLTDHGGEAGRPRAELLKAHEREWADLPFARWLRHQSRSCHNPRGHEFCKVVRQGVLSRLERDRLPEGTPRRKALDDELELLGARMEAEFGYLPGTGSMPLFERAAFRRGFLEAATAYDFAVQLFADALPAAGVLRELTVEEDSGEGCDAAVERLTPVLRRLPLASLDCGSITEPETLRRLLRARALRRLTRLSLSFEDPDWGAEDGDLWVSIVAGSPNLCGLRELDLGHSRTFTDAAFLEILDSPHLAGLTACRLRPNEDMPLSASVVLRFAERFGPQIEQDAVIIR